MADPAVRLVGSTAMPCPACGFDRSKTVESRSVSAVPSLGGAAAKRRHRVCVGCSHAWTTYEVDEEVLIASVNRLVPAGVQHLLEKLIAKLSD